MILEARCRIRRAQTSVYGRPMADLDDVDRIARTLPEAVEFERHGLRAWSVRDKVFAWEREFSKADLKRFGDDPVPRYPILAVRVADQNDKEAALSAGTVGVFSIPHFNGFNAVLIRLDAVSDDDLTGGVDRRLAGDGAALVGEWLAVRQQAESGRCQRAENAASNAAAGGSKASRRTNASASGAPTSRSMPASSHSTEIGPVVADGVEHPERSPPTARRRARSTRSPSRGAGPPTAGASPAARCGRCRRWRFASLQSTW